MTRKRWAVLWLGVALLFTGCELRDTVSSVTTGSDAASAQDSVADDDVAPEDATAFDAEIAEDSVDDVTAADATADATVDVIEDAVEEVIEPPPEPPARPALSDAEKARLTQALDGIFASSSVAGHTLSARIEDAETGEVLYSVQPDSVMKPASNTKLVTTAAALALLGPDHRFMTRGFATTGVDGSGVLAGDLVVTSEHDFTASTFFYPNAAFPLDMLAARLYAAGLREVQGDLRLHGEMLYEAYRFGYYDADAYRTASAEQLRAALTRAGISVTGQTLTDPAFDAPAGATELASYASLPLWVACSEINRPSHNEFTDALLRHLGWVRRGESSYAAGAAEVLDWLEASGIDTTGMSWNDGSGLSHDNRVSANQLIALMAVMDTLPEGRAWSRGFAVSGMYGTLAGRMTGSNIIGRVHGKTGTLNGVITLSGVLHHKHHARRYRFSLLMNNVPNASSARAVLDQALAVLGAPLALPARPEPPTLHCARSQGDVAEITWAPSASAVDGYVVWTSPDGRVWDRAQSVYTQDLEATLPITAEAPLFVRVTALSAAGAESEPSDVYGVWAGGERGAALLVDGNDRWEGQPSPENALRASHDFAVDVAAAAEDAGWSFDVCANEAATAGLDAYPLVVWSAGEDSVDDESLSGAEQVALRAYVEGGGALVLSGAELAYDLLAQGSGSDRAFLEDLGVGYVSDDAETLALQGTDAFALGLSGFYAPGGVVVSYPDVLSATGGNAAVALTYASGVGGAAAIRSTLGSGSALVMGVPLETLDTKAARADVLRGFAP